MNLIRIIISIAVICTSHFAFARGGGGGHALGGGFAFITPGQNDLNGVITEVNAAQSIAIDKPGTGYEFFAHYTYQFSGTMFALQFRPSYVMQNSSGGGHDVKLSGFTFFPIFKMIPLENSFIKFFMQVGLGYGQLSGEFSGGGNSIAWKGGAFGALGGLGAEFCFTDNHCMMIEGNMRYLPFERNLVSSVGGDPTQLGFDSGMTGDAELENNNRDIGTTLSGVQGIVAYTYNF